MSADPKKPESGPGTTGHEWDGIEELNNPLPRWWLWIFYASIAFSLVWVVLYPAIPIPGGYTKGTLGYSGRTEGEQALAALKAFDGPDEDRAPLVKEAATAVWYYFIQREACGIRDQRPAIAHYAIPREVLMRLGAS